MVDIKLRDYETQIMDIQHYVAEYPKGTTVMDVIVWLMNQYDHGTCTLTVFGYDKKNPPSIKFHDGVYETLPNRILKFEIFGLRVSKSRSTGQLTISISI